MILDLGEEAANTNMAGGPSDRRFSRWYFQMVQGLVVRFISFF